MRTIASEMGPFGVWNLHFVGFFAAELDRCGLRVFANAAILLAVEVATSIHLFGEGAIGGVDELLGADGVHLGQDDGTVEEARQRLGREAQIGVTCHDSRHLAMEASEGGADYVAFGAFHPTKSKDAEKLAKYGTPTTENTSIWQLVLKDINVQFPIRTAALDDIDGLEANVVDDMLAEFAQAEARQRQT